MHLKVQDYLLELQAKRTFTQMLADEHTITPIRNQSSHRAACEDSHLHHTPILQLPWFSGSSLAPGPSVRALESSVEGHACTLVLYQDIIIMG